MTESGESDDERRARGLPPEPGGPRAPGGGATPPTPVTVAFALYVLTGLLLVATFGYTLTQQQAVSDALIDLRTDESLNPEQIRSGVSTLLWTLFVGAVVFAVLYALFGWKARQGTRSARTVLTVLAVVTLLLQLLLFSTSLPMLAASLLALVATVLLYLPSVADHFPRPGGSTGPARPGGFLP